MKNKKKIFFTFFTFLTFWGDVPEKLAQTNYVPKVPESGTNLAQNIVLPEMEINSQIFG